MIRSVVLYNFIVVPLRCGFFPFLVSPALIFFDYVGDVLMLVDLFIQTRTAFRDRGVWIVDFDDVWRHRTHTVWFVFDVLGSVPILDFVMIGTGMNAAWRLPRLFRMLGFLRSEHTYVSTNEHIHRMLQLIAVLVIVSHLVSCGYFAFTMLEGFSAIAAEGFVPAWLPDESYRYSSVLRQYLRSTFFSLSSLTCLGHVLHPGSNAQYVYSIVVMLFGKFFTAFLVGSVAGIMTQLGLQKTRFGSTMYQLHEFAEQVRASFHFTS